MNTKYLLLPLAALSWPLMAEQVEQDENVITVTADYRESSKDDTTASVSVLNAEDLKQAAEQHLEEVINLIPNLNWAGGSSRPKFFQIRGIGELDQYEGAPNPSVAMIIDDIDFSSMGMLATLFDIDQVEVLRGPQSARYGANAIAGMINVRSRDPQAENELRSQFILGEDSTYGVALSASGSLSDDKTVMGLISIDQYMNNGFRYNNYLNTDDTNARDEFNLRAKLRWLPADNHELKLTLIKSELDNGYDVWALDNTYLTRTDKPGVDAQQTDAFSARYQISGDEFDWLFITTYADIDNDVAFDGDWGNPDYWGADGPYDFTSDTDRQRTTSTNEVRLLSKPISDSNSMDWVVGLYQQSLEEDNDITELYNGALYRRLTSSYSADTLAIYGQARWALAEDTTLSVSLRRERREADYQDTAPVSFNPTDTMNGGEISLVKEHSDTLSSWYSIARGYKAGGFNLSLSIPSELRQFDPEYVVNAEAGLRGRNEDGSLNWSVSLFNMQREDVQISTSQQLDPTDPLTFIFLIDNAAEGYNRGIEADLQWQMAQNWSLDATLGYLDTQIDNFQGTEDRLEGREQAHAPSYMMSLALNYADDAGWFGRVQWQAKDEFYYSFSHDQIADASSTMNLKFGYQDTNWSYYLWAQNIFDQKYTVRGFYFANEPPDFPVKLYERLGDPRHVGITVRYQY